MARWGHPGTPRWLWGWRSPSHGRVTLHTSQWDRDRGTAWGQAGIRPRWSHGQGQDVIQALRSRVQGQIGIQPLRIPSGSSARLGSSPRTPGKAKSCSQDGTFGSGPIPCVVPEEPPSARLAVGCEEPSPSPGRASFRQRSGTGPRSPDTAKAGAELARHLPGGAGSAVGTGAAAEPPTSPRCHRQRGTRRLGRGVGWK